MKLKDNRESIEKLIDSIYSMREYQLVRIMKKTYYDFALMFIVTCLLTFYLVMDRAKSIYNLPGDNVKVLLASLVISYAFGAYFYFWLRKSLKVILNKSAELEIEKQHDIKQIDSLTSDDITILLRIENLRKENTEDSFKQEIKEALASSNIAKLKCIKYLEIYSNS
ncbi:hypothetical protein HGB13_01660 [bacterium]|nr:hypothetical protein [bacterium]